MYTESLHPYQNEIVSAVYAQWKQHTSTVFCIPTGTGKTRTALNIVKNQRFLFVVHRDYLIDQTLNELNSGDVTVRSGKRKTGNSPSVIATIQWLSAQNNLTKLLDERPFDVLVIDEAHHTVADSYQFLVKKFEEYNPQAKIVGMTATLQRADNVPLKEVFHSLAYFKPIKFFVGFIDNEYIKPYNHTKHLAVVERQLPKVCNCA